MNGSVFDSPPAGAGLNTETFTVPAVPTAMSAAGISAVSCVPENVVGVMSAPFQRTTELLTKPVPSTVRVKAAPPAVALDGVSEVTVGIGLGKSM